MAKKSELPFVVDGYAQVEPNRLTAMVNGEMESQAPAIKANRESIEVIENGMFLVVVPDVVPVGGTAIGPMGRIAVLPGDTTNGADETDEAYLVFNERKVYDERENLKDYAMIAEKSVDGLSFPRLFKITAGDIYTTNCINEDAADVALGDVLYVGDDGYLAKTAGTNKSLCFQVVKVYTMPGDNQPGVKVMAQNYK